jgi:hypothetical protein
MTVERPVADLQCRLSPRFQSFPAVFARRLGALVWLCVAAASCASRGGRVGRDSDTGTSWVRCIGSAGGSPRQWWSARSGAPIASWSTTAIGSPARLRVPLVGTSGGSMVRTPGAARDTQPISGADRRRQGQPVRAERSEPRSGGLDGRRAAELCRSTGGESRRDRPARDRSLPRSGETVGGATGLLTRICSGETVVHEHRRVRGPMTRLLQSSLPRLSADRRPLLRRTAS